ncbi:MAG TPA: TIGR03084 family metal-binding protein [Trebonia sp.]|nr:TIGR03084 family metal-binding protein [Trebonia sp.]
MSGARRELVFRLADDLAGETAGLLPLLARLGEADWDAPTPAAGWSIRDQVTHLAFFDDTSLVSIRDRAAFIAGREELRSLGDRFPDVIAEQHRHLPGGYCLEWLASSRAALVRAYKEADHAVRLPWYGPDFSVAASITGRLMETWAHGQDIADCLGVVRPPTGRLRHVADIGIRALPFSFASRGLPVPREPVYVELAAPPPPAGTPGGSGGSPSRAGTAGGSGGPPAWTWGPPDAANRVTGDALDFCLVVTQRRNVADTGLTVTGDVAAAWIAVAQAFAGRPTDPRPPAAAGPAAGSRPPDGPGSPAGTRSAT